MTHLSNSPWEQTRSKNIQKVNSEIDDELVKSYFLAQ
jgi:hypothetical protein